MKKSVLVSLMAERASLHKTEAETLLAALTSVIVEELKRNGEFELYGIAKFRVVDRTERVGRNPKTGESMLITARKSMVTRISGRLKNAVFGE